MAFENIKDSIKNIKNTAMENRFQLSSRKIIITELQQEVR